jgi:tetratricopeptide (TPR) repeat protein
LYVPKKNVAVKLDKKDTEFKKINNTPVQLKEPERKTSPTEEKQTSSEAQVFIKQDVSLQSSLERRIAKFRKRIKNNPSDTISLIALADLYKKAEKFSEATKFYCFAIKQFEKDIFFDEAEKIRVIYNVAHLFEKTNKNNMALKYYHYLLRHKCNSEQKKDAVAAISRLRLKTLN